jgi:hypothetical protein
LASEAWISRIVGNLGAPDSQLESRGGPEQASIPTTHGASFSARAISVSRLTLRRMTNRAGRIQPNHAAEVLAEVDAKHGDIHPFLLLIGRRAYDAGRRGPFHKTLRASEHDRPEIKQAPEEWTLTRRPIMRLEPHRVVFLDETERPERWRACEVAA